MEAVPRLHMLWFSFKSSPEGTNFSSLKRYIAEVYQEDPESYSKEVQALETLRNQAMHLTKDGSSIQLMKRYYCQLHALHSRFPQVSERRLLTFHWKNLYGNQVHKVHEIRYEMAAVLFNIAATHTQVGASVTRGDADGMKLACTHFQCAAWCFGELREKYAKINEGNDFMTAELLTFMQQVAFAQAQECILEKSLIDNRKPNIVAKVTSQIATYYGDALAALLTGDEDGAVAQVIESSVYKLWKKYVRFKISYLNCILYLYQGQYAEEQQKMGERVTLYQAAWEKLEEARKESRGLPDQKEINESLIFTADVVEAKRKNAKNENEFIYHETIPDLSDIGAVHGANLVNGISFSVTDPEVMGDDIFARLVPMKAHEASSIYSEKKAQLLRKYGALIEERDNDLATFMSSLTLEPLNVNEEKANKIPQGIVDRCAAMNSNKTAITELINAMQQLVEMTTDVELNLKEICGILEVERQQEQEFQKVTGVQRTSNAHIIELMREYQKYMEAHARAGESNETLRKAMELHVNNLKILAQPMSDIQKSIPKLSGESNTANVFKEVKLLLNKVNEMKAQRQQFHAELRIAIAEDDITSKVIAQGIDEGDEVALNHLFNQEFSKHERLTQLLDQNLAAQKNILCALTDSYALAAPLIKSVADVKQKRDTFFSSLAASYDVYEDLLAKSAKGLEFYKKLSGNVHKLLTRLKSARDVQTEERQQRLQSVSSPQTPHAYNPASSTSSAPKLRDFLQSNSAAAMAAPSKAAFSATSNVHVAKPKASATYIPPIRPNPLGSEAPSVDTVCQTSAYYTGNVTPATSSSAPNEPPPPYSFVPDAVFSPNMMNTMLQHNYNAQFQMPQQTAQQNIAPPAYTAQASPNSQFSIMNSKLSNLSLQQQPLQNQPYQQQLHHQQPSQQYQQQIHQQQTIQQQQLVHQQQALHQQQPLQQQQPLNQHQTLHQQQQQYQPLQNQSLQQEQNLQQQIPYLPNYGENMSMTAPAVPVPSTTGASISMNSYNNQNSMYSVNATPNVNKQPIATTSTFSSMEPLYVATTSNDSTYNLQQNQMLNLQQQYQQQYQQYQQKPTSSSNLTQQQTPTGQASATNHPGYMFNSLTGHYEYGSGYHHASHVNDEFYGKYTSSTPPVGTTDSESARKINVATGFDAPIVSHLTHVISTTSASSFSDYQSINKYYTQPYGVTQQQQLQVQQQPQLQIQQQPQQQIYNMTSIPHYVQQATESQEQQQRPQYPIYMQSGKQSMASTTTTKSAAEYASSVQQQKTSEVQANTQTKISNIDLLSDMNLTDSEVNNVPPPILPVPVKKVTVATEPVPEICETKQAVQDQTQPATIRSNLTDNHDNISISSDLSSLDTNFDWEINKLPSIASSTANAFPNNNASFIMRPCDPFVDTKILKYFHKEVERYEKMIESLNVKMLNGNTQLQAKWKELQEILNNDNNKRSTAVARLFPEKNRGAVHLPFDHTRVKLERNTDDYINAALITVNVL